MGAVSCIASSYSLRVFASGGVDGIVKIWDQHSSLIREIQFNEPIQSLCFANEKGDLLIGLSGQIAIIRCYDYLPMAYLRLLVQMAPFFKDNPVIVDRPRAFDPDSKYWEKPTVQKPDMSNFEEFQLERLVRLLRQVDDPHEISSNEAMDPFRVALLKSVS